MRNLLIFLAALLGTQGLFFGYAPLPCSLDGRMNAFLENKDDYEVLFVGSSLTQLQVIPSEIREESGIRSFNLGLNSARGHEMNQIIAKVLASQPAKLKAIVIEARPWYPARSDVRNEPYSPRMTWWHTPGETVSFLRTMRLRPDGPAAKEQVPLHLKAALARWANMGAGLAAFTQTCKGPPHEDGWTPLIKDNPSEKSEDKKQRLRARDRWVKNPRSADDYATFHALQRTRFEQYNLNAFDQRDRRLEAAGVQSVYLLAPTWKSYANDRALQSAGRMTRLIDFADPKSHPEFFAFENRRDKSHLNLEGSRLYSRAIANRLREFLGEEQPSG